MPRREVDATSVTVPEKLYGYNGNVPGVNLSNGKVDSEATSEQSCCKYLGGAGFIAYYFWKERKPNTGALSPDNKLIFASGPATGLSLPGVSRNCIGATPVTGGATITECGGYWMVE